MFNEVERFVKKSFRNRKDKKQLWKQAQIVHLQRNSFWIQKLKPDADEALLIAGIAHDIERAFRFNSLKKLRKDIHQKRSAKIIVEFLTKRGAQKEMIKRVKFLVSKHEEGGNADQNLLKDADSISFLENNVYMFLKMMVPRRGKKKVRQKFDWMYSRITSKKAKSIAKPMYKKAIEKLEKL